MSMPKTSGPASISIKLSQKVTDDLRAAFEVESWRMKRKHDHCYCKADASGMEVRWICCVCGQKSEDNP